MLRLPMIVILIAWYLIQTSSVSAQWNNLQLPNTSPFFGDGSQKRVGLEYLLLRTPLELTSSQATRIQAIVDAYEQTEQAVFKGLVSERDEAIANRTRLLF